MNIVLKKEEGDVINIIFWVRDDFYEIKIYIRKGVSFLGKKKIISDWKFTESTMAIYAFPDKIALFVAEE